MSPKNQGRPPSPDDAWANLDESDDWHERSGVREGGGHDRIVQTATNMRIRPEEAQKATKGPHLVVVAGAEVGRIYALSGSEVTVGRGEMNDIVLADGSVSRQHARLERRQEHWYVHDLDSGNGTFVKARRVRSAELPVGEQVGFGQVRLQLRESRVAPEAGGNRASGPRLDRTDTSVARGPAAKAASPAVASATAGQAPRPALRPGPAGGGAGGARPTQGSELSLAQLRPALAAAGRSVWGKAALAAAVLCLGAGWLALYLEGRSSAEEVFRLCQHAAKSFDAREFDEAEQALALARALVPQHPRVASWTAALRQARADEERLAAAREAAAAGDLATARAHVQVLAGSSLYAQVEQLDTELDRAEKALLVEAHTALQAGLQQEAGALLARLGAAAPGEEGTREDPRQRSDVAALARWRRAQQTDAPLLAKAERWGARPRRKLSLWEQAEGQSPALRRALTAFRNARAEAASRLGLRALGRPQVHKDRQVAGAMQRFATLWDTGLEEHRGKRAFAAIRVFTDAKLLALALGGEGSVPVRELNARLADMYYVVGMQAFAAGKLAEAAEALRVALGLSPEHALSARRMEEIEDRAVHMVDQAEFIGKKHPARATELLRQVAAAMPPPSEVGGRARRLLQGATP